MGGRGAEGHIPVTQGLIGIRATPNVYKDKVRDRAQQVLMELNPPEAVQIIIRRSFRGGEETVTLIDNAINSLMQFGVTSFMLDSYISMLEKSTRKELKDLPNKRTAVAYDASRAKIEASMLVVNKLKSIAKEKKKN